MFLARQTSERRAVIDAIQRHNLTDTAYGGIGRALNKFKKRCSHGSVLMWPLGLGGTQHRRSYMDILKMYPFTYYFSRFYFLGHLGRSVV